MDLKSFVFYDVVCLSEVYFSVNEILSKLLKITDCSMAACDCVSPTIYYRAAEISAPFVYLIFTHVKESLTWPNLWKCAHISPIHKVGSRADVEHYRSISILPQISIIFERNLSNCIYSKLEHAFNPLQHGFRSKHSKVTQLIVFLLNFDLNFDKNIEQVVVYLDFGKAFDLVDNFNLLKWARIGFDKSFLSLVYSYLSCRRQRINIDGFLSHELDVTSGVPQSSF